MYKMSAYKITKCPIIPRRSNINLRRL